MAAVGEHGDFLNPGVGVGAVQKPPASKKGVLGFQTGFQTGPLTRAKPKFPKNLDWRERTPSVVSPVKSAFGHTQLVGVGLGVGSSIRVGWKGRGKGQGRAKGS